MWSWWQSEDGHRQPRLLPSRQFLPVVVDVRGLHPRVADPRQNHDEGQRTGNYIDARLACDHVPPGTRVDCSTRQGCAAADSRAGGFFVSNKNTQL